VTSDRRHLLPPPSSTVLVGGYDKEEVDQYVETAHEVVAGLRQTVGQLKLAYSTLDAQYTDLDRRGLAVRALAAAVEEVGLTTFRLVWETLPFEKRTWVLALLAPPTAARLLSSLEREASVLCLLALSDPTLVPLEDLVQTAEGLVAHMTGRGEGSEALGSPTQAADVVNALGALGNEIMAEIAGSTPATAALIEAQRVRPETLLEWPKSALRTLLKGLEVDDLAAFLAVQPTQIVTRIRECLSMRAAEHLMEAVQKVDPQDTARINASVHAVLEHARDVHAKR